MLGEALNGDSSGLGEASDRRRGGMKDVLAVIPCHSRSTRVPRKNFERLGGVELWEIAVRKAREAGIRDIVVVSDEYRRIWEMERDVFVVDHPEHITRARFAAEYGVKEWVEGGLGVVVPEIVVQIGVDAPFTTPETVGRLVEMVRKHPQRPAHLVTRGERPEWYRFDYIEEDRPVVEVDCPEDPDYHYHLPYQGRRMYKEIGYHLAGDMTASTTKRLFEEPWFDDQHSCVEISRQEAYEIDWPEELEFAKFVWDRWNPFEGVSGRVGQNNPSVGAPA